MYMCVQVCVFVCNVYTCVYVCLCVSVHVHVHARVCVFVHDVCCGTIQQNALDNLCSPITENGGSVVVRVIQNVLFTCHPLMQRGGMRSDWHWVPPLLEYNSGPLQYKVVCYNPTHQPSSCLLC